MIDLFPVFFLSTLFMVMTWRAAYIDAKYTVDDQGKVVKKKVVSAITEQERLLSFLKPEDIAFLKAADSDAESWLPKGKPARPLVVPYDLCGTLISSKRSELEKKYSVYLGVG